MRIVFFQPDIPQNLGAAMRVAACFGADLDVIEPCAFPLTAKGIRKAAMDYQASISPVRHSSWSRYLASPPASKGRLVLFTTRGADNLWDFKFRPDDRLLFGRESAGVPDEVHDQADARVIIPIRPETRSLNVVVSAGIALAEAQRQLR
ncbi:MAG: tRNA (cytidine(34)-2'-O)-methyltransferase [Maricaulis sp.]|jgi:tRNA (cytidine/uridine-2'-O-)-methyltransferase|uniref:tRNA (cytidine(34)-2'-O)-methyltransferase n=1 Tax=Maricaulis sp. TaxID=1486257 RepID=UPI002638D67C|nr:tRNA (cytidine(34)-2'-O)-methyltransferase [Maricaulis sp.]MDM7985407.1 tRNA (cytidine(34)-2'-O)-methyltransferase [Maricaulis sp.]